jgi:autotransporter strand-loop-strand O-heptosyltransferase
MSNSIKDISNPYFVSVPEVPTQEGPRGIRYDFNDGARVLLPKGHWYVQLEDADADNILFGANTDGNWVLSTKRYYIKHRIRVWDRDTDEEILDVTMDLKDKPVLVKFPVGTMGDIIAWMTYVDRFQRKHGCKLELTLQKRMAEIFEKQYPNIQFTYLPGKPKTQNPYASYLVGLFFGGDLNFQPVDFRLIGLHEQAGYILGVDTTPEAPKVELGSPRLIRERYVCIACKGSSQNKYWNNGYGWEQVVDYLKSIGYRVLCIDKERTEGKEWIWNRMPAGVEDFTGNRPLKERIALLEHADFFVGLGSGLSWLAWCCHIPVVMISGFSMPWCEFPTPYRVFNPQACHGCWNDINVKFEHDYMWCPRQKNTPRMFECTRLIPGRMVISKIRQLIKDNNWLTPNCIEP